MSLRSDCYPWMNGFNARNIYFSFPSSIHGTDRSVSRIFPALLLVFLCLLTQPSGTRAENYFHVGVSTGLITPQRDFGRFWTPSFSAGLSAGKLLHKGFDLSLTGYFSHHRPRQPEPVPPGYLSHHSSVLFFHMAIRFRLDLFSLAVTPALIAEINNNTFISYVSWPPLPNSGESEIGMAVGLMLHHALNNRLSFGISFLQHRLFTQPYPLFFGSLEWQTTLTIDRPVARKRQTGL